VVAASAPAQGRIDGYPCPQCGAPTAFKPGTEHLVCDHCDTRVPIARSDAAVVTYDLLAKATHELVQARAMTQGGREVACKVCGARAVTARQAERCAFCDSPMIVEVDEGDRSIPPGGVLPFTIDRAGAGERFKVWLRTRWFAPRDLVKRAQRDALDGVYLPYWTYDAQTYTQYRGERGEYYYETESYSEDGETKTRQVRKTRWYSTSGSVEVGFEDVLVCGSPSLPQELLEKLEPWDLRSLRAFEGRYLAGFLAEKYRIDPEAGFQTAGERMEPTIRKAIRRDIGGDEQRIASMDVDYRQVGFRHLLLPLWLTAFRYKDRLFHVTVNARTGEVAGERPWSVLKIVALVIVIAAIIAVIAILARR
jgi:hypothetical protein